MEKNGTQCFESGSQRQLGQQVCLGRRDHQHRPEGKLSQSEAENFRDENEADQSKIETVCFGLSETNVRDPCVLFSEELSRRDNKGLSNQNGEVLIPINKQRQNNR